VAALLVGSAGGVALAVVGSWAIARREVC
jgi:hypothetical protein